jgi:hypothetical protein
MTARRFPAPKMPGGYVVRDANGQALAYVYSRPNEAEALQAKVLMEEIGKVPSKLVKRFFRFHC